MFKLSLLTGLDVILYLTSKHITTKFLVKNYTLLYRMVRIILRYLKSFRCVDDPGASTQGGNGAKCTMAKIGGECCDDNDAFGRVYNNLLLHEYIYYFTPVHF